MLLLCLQEIILHTHKAEAMRNSLEDLKEKTRYTISTESIIFMNIYYKTDILLHVLHLYRQCRLVLQEDQARKDPFMITEK